MSIDARFIYYSLVQFKFWCGTSVLVILAKVLLHFKFLDKFGYNTERANQQHRNSCYKWETEEGNPEHKI